MDHQIARYDQALEFAYEQLMQFDAERDPQVMEISVLFIIIIITLARGELELCLLKYPT